MLFELLLLLLLNRRRKVFVVGEELREVKGLLLLFGLIGKKKRGIGREKEKGVRETKKRKKKINGSGRTVLDFVVGASALFFLFFSFLLPSLDASSLACAFSLPSRLSNP